ncbi:MAG: hypothetical protein A3J65_02650 [Candidatus Buchananbacteria bacterium RIFCSPHIGHO2_02_FULL_45_11b]|uniref:Uncharacterized protein n=4 Tax=Candidatus Buchananiibacteriota TaxID=1817903 RepID=A0A1G1Y2F8_9BACT|nr:MAG: hypothetical protein A2663_00720 [Candidatus Buchananbacteria bacterium RIFCSPHIGHO2_01_FULL_46_12]OGY50778.1 MAG: hypothetical protein A3J65_02650 [Candidatus Buchananbacteria bacterium RIFCSPHIGHO2_02_FULL_45_11b]OGY52826.1 MAG: hypothetical protein A3B15_00865 [Candidatus Buchananbacteria bacterium RIFCSPLOWO2_01_FULL_45_31]OGY56451.1 MAG: hypothetical protein A3H67_05290 [Candidatus Buchananbacteria bacterium RIFCSPLOWO2_02_FULL_46_11b]
MEGRTGEEAKDQMAKKGEEFEPRIFGLIARKKPEGKEAKDQTAAKEGEPPDLICPWCNKDKLAVKRIVRNYDGDVKLEGGSARCEIKCETCGVNIEVPGFESGTDKATAPIRELVALRKKVAEKFPFDAIDMG